MRSSKVVDRIQHNTIRLLSFFFLLFLFFFTFFPNSNNQISVYDDFVNEKRMLNLDSKDSPDIFPPSLSSGEQRDLIEDWSYSWNGSVPFDSFIRYDSNNDYFYTVNPFRNNSVGFVANDDFNITKINYDKTILWNRSLGAIDRDDQVNAFMLSKNGSRLYVFSYIIETNTIDVYIINSEDGELLDFFSFGFGYSFHFGKTRFDPSGRYAYLSGIYYPTSNNADGVIWKLDLYTNQMIWNFTWGLPTRDEEIVGFDVTTDGSFLYCIAFQYESKAPPFFPYRDEVALNTQKGNVALLQLNSTGFLHHVKMNTTVSTLMPRDMCLSADETTLNIIATDNSESFTKMAFIKWDLAGNHLLNQSYPIFEKMEYASFITKSPWNSSYYIVGKQISTGTFSYHRGKIAEINLNGSLIWENTTDNPLNTYHAYQDMVVCHDNGYLAFIGYRNLTIETDSFVFFHLYGYNLTKEPSATYLFSNDIPSWDGILDLNWTEVERAQNYSVYRAALPFIDLSTAVCVASGITELNYSDASLENGTYYYRIVAVGEYGNSTPSNILIMTVSTFGTPFLNSLIHSSAENNQVLLEWTNSSEKLEYVLNYFIYRNYTENIVPEYSIPIYITPDKNVLNYLDVDVPSGTWYYAVVCYYFIPNTGYNSSISNIRSIEIKNLPSPPIITIQSPDPQVGAITINWTLVDGATAYNVYRTRGSFSDLRYYSPIGITDCDCFFDDPDDDLYYKYLVIATNSSGSSLSSNIVEAFIISPILAPQLSGPNYNITDGEIYLNWSASAGAEAYYLYKSTDPIFSVENITPYNISTSLTLDFYEMNYTLGVFYFVVVAGKPLLNSSISNCINISVHDLPSKPGNLVIVNADNSFPEIPKLISERFISLTWSEVEGALYYEIYRSEFNITDKAYAIKIDDAFSTYFLDLSLDLPSNYQKRFFYVIAAVNWSGTSIISENVNITLDFSPDPVVLSPISQPYNRSVSLSWNAGNFNTEVYKVYRYHIPLNETNWETLRFEIISHDVYGTAYIDHSVPFGVWYYAIIAQNYYLSNFSNCEQVEVKATPLNVYLFQPISPSFTRNVTLNWTEADMVLYYRVYRSNTSITEEMLGSITPFIAEDNTYIDYFVPGGIWYYGIIVYNATGTSPLSNIVSVDVRYVPHTPLWNSPPSENVVNRLNLTWNDPDAYNNYSVYFGAKNNFSDISVILLGKNLVSPFFFYEFQFNGTFFFWVLAHNASGDSFPTSLLMINCYLVNAPQIQLISANPAITHSVHLIWSPSNNSVSYKLYRTLTIPSNYSEEIPYKILQASDLTYLDQNVPLGFYYYTIIPVSLYGDGNISQILTVRVEDLPDSPFIFNVVRGFGDEVIVSWNAGLNVDHFIAYVSKQPIKNGTPLIDYKSSPKLNSNTRQFSFDGIGYGIHYFVVVAVNSTGTSFYSNCIEFDNHPPETENPISIYAGIGVAIFLIVAIPLCIKVIRDRRANPSRLLNKYI